MKAVNIKWDTDGDDDLQKELPKEIEIPDHIMRMAKQDGEAIGDYLSDQTGFCHFGYSLKK